jgi:Predicted esterase of the alpha/beta hydrolase fold
VRTSVLFIQGGGEGAHEEDDLLAASLRKALGTEYEVHYPRMPGESNPDLQIWKAKIAKELKALDGEVILVGHSIGGAAILKCLAEENIERAIAGLFVLAAPSWDDEKWNFDDLRLPRDLATKLARIPRVFLYHNRDDEIVPFSHLAHQAAKLPRAVVRESDTGGHQFGNDLTNVASDIKLNNTRAKQQNEFL